MATVFPPRHIVWSTDRVDLSDPPTHPAPGRSRGFLRSGCYFLSRGRGVDSELMFGDYYLVEALVRYLDFQAWA